MVEGCLLSGSHCLRGFQRTERRMLVPTANIRKAGGTHTIPKENTTQEDTQQGQLVTMADAALQWGVKRKEKPESRECGRMRPWPCQLRPSWSCRQRSRRPTHSPRPPVLR